MKKLGLVGGIGPESTIPYYRDIVYGVRDRVGGNFFPNLCIESVSVFDVLGFCARNDYEGLTAYVSNAIENLVKSGAEIVAITGNTPHIVFEQLQKRSPVTIISIVEATRNQALQQGRKRLGLLGTGATMRADFFKEPFRRSDIVVVTPREDEIAVIDRIISSELELGIIKEESLRVLQRIIARMQKDEAIEALILGCTELPLLLNDDVSPVPCLDTMKIHIDVLIDEILK